MKLLNTFGKAVGSWIQHRAEDFKFWYDKAKEDFSNGRPLSGFKNIGVGALDIVLQGEITDIYQEDLQPALHEDSLSSWKDKYMGENAKPGSLASIYGSMAEYSKLMVNYTKSVAADNGMSESRCAVKDYLKKILDDGLNETSPYITELLTSQTIKGSKTAAYHDLLKEYEDTLSLANNDAKTEKQNAIIDKLADQILGSADNMIKENGADKMTEFYSAAQKNYAAGNVSNDKYEQTVRELGIIDGCSKTETFAETSL